ncbi:MAG: response regulator [Chloroflexota bacterium]|nr:response regulator [Chloroflexota bacterium]
MTTKHILIVDDEPKVAFFLSKAVEHANEDCRVSIAHSGEEALEVINRSQVNLLVTDLRMPGINGLELIRWVRASSPQTHTLLITAYGNDEVKAEAHRLEDCRYITKPFDIGDFTQIVQEALSDVAISSSGLVALSGESFETIFRHLEDLHRDTDARCIILADMLGQRVAEVGVTTGIDISTLLSLLAGGFATSGELARHSGSGQAANLNFHQGTRYEIYSANVGDNFFLAIIYDRRAQTSRIGIVWLYTRRAVDQLLSTLLTTAASTPTQSLDADFGASLMSEMDSLFTEGPSISSPLQGAGSGASTLSDPPTVGEDDMERTGGDEASKESVAFEATIAQGIVSAETPAVRDTDTRHAGEDEPGEELFDLEAAIARGIIPADLGSKQGEIPRAS